MAQIVWHRNDNRGRTDHGWLKSYHTFSFGMYVDPERIRFGALRVLNDDVVEGNMGFGEHPHDNMEIISIPLAGTLEHRDSMGNSTIIKPGEIQVMSAGTGVYHSEYNQSKHIPVAFLQIWIFPKVRNVAPRYDQFDFSSKHQPNQFIQILSPVAENQGVWIYQDAWMYIGEFQKGEAIDYTLHDPAHNGLYLFVIEGAVDLFDQELQRRDAAGVWETDRVKAVANTDAKLLLIEVPMNID